MQSKVYQDQVRLLLSVLPEVAKEECFALHGGTAINLFVRDMPRLSVDIDLTYVPIQDRQTSFAEIRAALGRIKGRVEGILAGVRIEPRDDILKLLISHDGAKIKLEVNQIGRGVLSPPVTMPLCDAAQEMFDAFCAVPMVSLGQLYGGKICAALDRQHPRDLFDVRYLLDNEGFSDDIREGFVLMLASSNRPFHEVLFPNLIDQRDAMANHFDGMTVEEFSYDDFEATRDELISVVQNALKGSDKAFLLSLKSGQPDWSIYDFQRFPAVQFKLQNLEKLKEANPQKHAAQYQALAEKLGMEQDEQA
ncbi:nucleotidyl transferase AbiEii/AbiGii toxin family protein [Maricaulis alexandrii]|uniref:nucleotidyl transferase AbiEii/AbiGii toxin family protein n=1 Tax=Maricaulis alexandrii TaxID=2570354 RepID=UPI001109060A|nr:nucleotidyl transferase AbiEii/AbiGii toxin family protein [Maricaulis alexandrii]